MFLSKWQLFTKDRKTHWAEIRNINSSGRIIISSERIVMTADESIYRPDALVYRQDDILFFFTRHLRAAVNSH